MSKFKIGDYVKRIKHCKTISEVVGPPPYAVTAVSPDGMCIQVNNWVASTRIPYPWYALNFVLDDEYEPALPPAPESVRYNEGAVGYTFEIRSLKENTYRPNRIRLGVLCGNQNKCKYVVIDPNSALQLAHDLRRMAMEIKRKEKQG